MVPKNAIWFGCLLIGLYMIVGWVRNRRENFVESPKPILLLGDSVLNNSIYVPPGTSVLDQLRQMAPQYTWIQKATDGATLQDTLQQVNQCPEQELGAIVLSAGGNDLLIYRQITSPMRTEWTQLVHRIREKYPQVPLFACNVYCPVEQTAVSCAAVIQQWNEWTHNQDKDTQVIDLNSILTNKTDFVRQIEPSQTGGTLIARAIKDAVLNI